MLRTDSSEIPVRLSLAVLIAGALLGAACLETKTERCEGGHLCPEGRVCDPAGASCIHPSQGVVCLGLPDGAYCTPEHSEALHLCQGEICRPSVCGDGLRDSRPGMDEACDDGNTAPGDGCRADCRGVEVCGDGYFDPDRGEVCDDGNLNDNDQCTRLCDRVRCGDGLLSGLELCDDGAANSDSLPDACRTGCIPPACDDSVVDTPDLTDCWSSGGALGVVTSPSRILAADLNGDQRDDLLVLSEEYERFEVYLATGDGTWIKTFYPVGDDVTSLDVADLDGDGAMDVVITVDAVPSLRIYLGDGAGALTLHTATGSMSHELWSVVVGDFDNDQVPDLAALAHSGCSIDLAHGVGDGSFGVASSSSVGISHCWSDSMRVADFDADGHLDLALAAAEDAVYVMAGDGFGQLADGVVYTGPRIPGTIIRDLAVADMDGDGLPDLVYSEQKPPQSPVRVLLNQGGFQFAEAPGTPLPLGLASLRLAAGDMTGDGVAEVAVVDYFAAVVFLIHRGADGSFEVLTPPVGGMTQNADDVAFGHFYDHGRGGLALLRFAENRVVFWSFDP